MRLRRLVVRDFRNLELVDLEPSPRFTVLEGSNGQGKTALLEAVYVLGALKSFRATRTDELIRHGAEEARLFAEIETAGVVRTVDVTLGPRRRRIELDGKVCRALGDALGQLTVVFFGPDDLVITKGSPSARRRFLDRAVFNRFPVSLESTRRYEVALQQRNAVLKDGGPDSLLDAFERPLALAAAEVTSWRLRFLTELRPFFDGALQEITHGDHTAVLSYANGVADPTAGGFEAGFRGARAADRRRGTTTVGPHVDDLDVALDGYPARAVASQGQHRALVLAMKVAEIRALEAGLGHRPVLLLDDVSSELDADRNARLMEYLLGPTFGGQVLLTTTDRAFVRAPTDVVDGHLTCFTIRHGQLSQSV